MAERSPPPAPFRPSPGRPPPHLGGRERETALFAEFVAYLEAGDPPPAEVVLYGPRGNGKTVLLHWLEGEIATRKGVECLTLAPSGTPDAERLSELLLPDSWWSRLTPAEVALAGFSWRPGKDTRPPPLEQILALRARNKPLALLVDEAHTLDLSVGRALLNASQYVGTRHPFLLVLAGTPNLQGHLNRMGASFWNRAEQIRVGRLGEAAAAEALRRPFEDGGISCCGEALAAMVRESQGYPYFVQLLGRAVWREAVRRPEGRRTVTTEALAAAHPEFERTKREYYVHRVEELRKRRLFRVGLAVADAFAGREVLDVAQFEGAIAGGLGKGADADAADRAAEVLGDLGYVWRVEGRLAWEPGIPSLMDYVREQAPAI